MLAAFLAALFFAFNATCANRSARALGGARANLGRLTVAVVVLAAFAHTLGGGLASASLPWFLLSGVIGMGLGDIAVFAALPLLGSRLTVLLTQCLAAPIAALGEWLWLGHRLTPAQMLWGVVIIAGVAFAIMPSRSSPPRVTVRPIGFLFGFLAACGQGLGALVSRRGLEAAVAAGELPNNASSRVSRSSPSGCWSCDWREDSRRLPPQPRRSAGGITAGWSPMAWRGRSSE